MKTGRITKGGQIGFPSEIRRRWGTSTVLLDDRGEYVIIRPAADDPVSQLRGAFAGRGISGDEGRGLARAEEAASETRRAR